MGLGFNGLCSTTPTGPFLPTPPIVLPKYPYILKFPFHPSQIKNPTPLSLSCSPCTAPLHPINKHILMKSLPYYNFSFEICLNIYIFTDKLIKFSQLIKLFLCSKLNTCGQIGHFKSFIIYMVKCSK